MYCCKRQIRKRVCKSGGTELLFGERQNVLGYQVLLSIHLGVPETELGFAGPFVATITARIASDDIVLYTKRCRDYLLT